MPELSLMSCCLQTRSQERAGGHTVPAMKKTLLRSVLHGLGVQCFMDGPAAHIGSATEEPDADAAALAEYFTQLNSIRSQRAAAYLSDANNINQLAVLCCILDSADELLYALLGGVDRQAPPCKVHVLLRRSDSLIGKVLATILHLLDSWLGPEGRRPWMIMDVLQAPIRDPTFGRWVRSQVLLMTSSLVRRYESKYNSLPYNLHRLCSGEYSVGEQQALAESVLAAPACCLDTFTKGLRHGFSTAEGMQSEACRRIIRAALDGLRCTTDMCERMNAEIQASQSSRARGRDFTCFARESVLKQVRTVHLHRHGADPLRPVSLQSALASCKAEVSPLLVDAPATETQDLCV